MYAMLLTPVLRPADFAVVSSDIWLQAVLLGGALSAWCVLAVASVEVQVSEPVLDKAAASFCC